MSALDDVLLVTKEGILQGDITGWKKVEAAREELAQLRYDYEYSLDASARLIKWVTELERQLQAAQERIAWLTSDIGESGLDAINSLIAACNRMDIPQQYTPDLSIARDEILRQARKLAEARNLIIRSGRVINNLKKPDSVYDLTSDLLDWLAANPAPSAEQKSDSNDAWIDSYVKVALRIDRQQP